MQTAFRIPKSVPKFYPHLHVFNEVVEARVAPLRGMYTILFFALFLAIAWLTWKRYALKMLIHHLRIYPKLITSSITSKRRVLALVVVAVARRKKLQLTMDAFTLTAASGVKLKLSKVSRWNYCAASYPQPSSQKLTSTHLINFTFFFFLYRVL
jgi:hypothetical protein